MPVFVRCDTDIVSEISSFHLAKFPTFPPNGKVVSLKCF